MYSLKMFTLERVRARHFTKAWGFVQGAESIPILIGVPITGYINQTNPKAGYYFSFVFTMIGAVLLFFVGYAKKPEPSNSFTSNINSECLCPISPQFNNHRYNTTNSYNSSNHFNSNINTVPNHYERVMNQYNNHNHHSSFINRNPHHRHSFKIIREPNQYHYNRDGLHKSLSYAAHMNYPDGPAMVIPQSSVHCITDQADFMNCNQYFKPQQLRSSKSVPEGLATRWDNHHWANYKRPIIRNVQVIEQITTSV